MVLNIQYYIYYINLTLLLWVSTHSKKKKKQQQKKPIMGVARKDCLHLVVSILY